MVGQLPERDLLHEVRLKALDKCRTLGWPNQRAETFQYFPLDSLYALECASIAQPSLVSKEEIATYVAPECRESYLLFVDGYFSQELSNTDAIDPKMTILPLIDAIKTFRHFLFSRWNQQIAEEKDPFVLLNLALHQQGIFIYIPPKLRIERPIQLLHIVKQEGSLITPRIQIFAGMHAEATFHSTSLCEQKDGLTLLVTDVALEEGAKVRVTEEVASNAGGWQLDYLRAHVKRSGQYLCTRIARNTSRCRKDLTVYLQGEEASTELALLVILKDQERDYLRASIRHEAPHTHSSQYFKGVLAGHSQSNIEGKIFVAQEAQKTEAYQLCKHLILDPFGSANIKPNLEIFADDVKASHGATVSQLKKDELFYLLSRGIEANEAKTLLLTGFCEEVLEKLQLDSHRHKVAQCLMSIR
jgi:Fe-S cluster assembly protein SufD